MDLLQLIKGRDDAAVKHCVTEVARTVHRSLGAPLASIRVIVHEVAASHWAVGDQTRDDIDAAQAPATLL